MQKFFFLPLLILLSKVSFAQITGEEHTDTTETSYFKISMDYLSNAVYLGRKDSASIPYLTPFIGYYNRSGLFAEASLSLIPKAGSGIDVFAIDGGYDFHTRNKKLTGELLAAKYFFTDSSKSVRSEVKGEADASLAYNFGAVSINGGVGVLFTSPADLVLDAGLSHEFDFGSDNEWSVTPTFLTNIGSLNFYKNFYKNRKLKKKRGVRTVTVTGKNNFSMLDYEFSLPISYSINKWSLLISPYYTVPVNPVKYFINGTFVKQETLSNNFFLEATISLEF